MKKINVVIVALSEKSLGQALNNLNADNANLVAVVIENGNGKFLNFGAATIPCFSLTIIREIFNEGKNFLWLICGEGNYPGEIYETRKFLMDNGVPKANIVNFEMSLSSEWIANLRHVEKFGTEFFATGTSYTEVGFNMRYIPHGDGVNLASSNQDLRQSYLTAKYVFEHVKPGTIKFVLIGLAPYSLCYDNAEDFSGYPHNLQYMFALNVPAQNNYDRLLKILVSDKVKNNFVNTGADRADLNFDDLKNSTNTELTVKAIATRETESEGLTKKLFPAAVEKNFQILQNYIQLCLKNGAKPIGIVFPFAPIIRKNYDEELLKLFRMSIQQLSDIYDFQCFDMFDLTVSYDCFYDMTHLNMHGAAVVNSLIGLRLYEKNLVKLEDFCDMNYAYFGLMTYLVSKEIYNSFMDKIFEVSVQKIRRKEKIKVAFVTDDAAMWSGDKLYNYFANDDRFEPTIFLCLRFDKREYTTLQKDLQFGIEQFKSRGLNVVGVSDPDAVMPAQDVIFYLRPYMNHFPKAFRLENLTPKTLATYIPYSFTVARDYFEYHSPIYYLPWKIFFSSPMNLKLIDGLCKVGVPRGIYSGYPRLDTIFEDKDKFKFNWKMTRPYAKKIIYAPHWSIKGTQGIVFSTFQWNYKFIYEFAKAHPEISWIFKPHPTLLFSAIESGVFPSAEAFEEYMQAWNDLPNAQVYTGGYYHEIFATSDGMIHDCGSFIAEYQYANKPMIYMTRNTQEFNELAKGILNASYTIDGRDLQGIAALMEKIFIAGEDPKRAEREKFFDENLNYYKQNGMSASEFIYREISRSLKE